MMPVMLRRMVVATQGLMTLIGSQYKVMIMARRMSTSCYMRLKGFYAIRK